MLDLVITKNTVVENYFIDSKIAIRVLKIASLGTEKKLF